MSEPATPPGPHARFPWAPALLCAASLAMAAWTWMRYSYAWATTPHALGLTGSGLVPSPGKDGAVDRPYVRVRGRFRRTVSSPLSYAPPEAVMHV